MNESFKPYTNESDVLRIGDLEIENRLDRLSITGHLVLTKDKAGLALAKELQALIGRAIRTLQAQKKLPDSVALKPVEVVQNPFA